MVVLTLQAAAEHGLEAILFCDTSHVFKEKNARVVTVDKGSDSADFALIRHVEPGDIVVTQDYGLAAMMLAKRGYPITQNGKRLADANIDTLLLARQRSQESPARRLPAERAVQAHSRTGQRLSSSTQEVD